MKVVAAIQQGDSVIVENCPQDIDAALNPVLQVTRITYFSTYWTYHDIDDLDDLLLDHLDDLYDLLIDHLHRSSS